MSDSAHFRVLLLFVETFLLEQLAKLLGPPGKCLHTNSAMTQSFAHSIAGQHMLDTQDKAIGTRLRSIRSERRNNTICFFNACIRQSPKQLASCWWEGRKGEEKGYGEWDAGKTHFEAKIYKVGTS